MVESVSNNLSSARQSELYSEYGEVIEALKEAFPDKTEQELHLAVREHLGTLDNKDISQMDTQKMLESISQTFNVELSAQEASKIISEWEDITQDFDIDVSNLASILTDYSSDGIDKSDRQYLILLWQMLQKEMEDAIGEEGTVTSETNRAIQEKNLEEYKEKKAEAKEKAAAAKTWGKIAKWAGFAVAWIGTAIATAVACIACVTGVGVPAAVALFTAAGIMGTLAVAATVAAVSDACGEEISVGVGVAKLVNLIPGVELDEDTFAMVTDMVIQIGLSLVAAALTLGVGAVNLISSIGKAAAQAAGEGVKAAIKAVITAMINALKQALKMSLKTMGDTMESFSRLLNVINGGIQVAQAGTQAVTAGINFDYSLTQADLMEIQALLESISDTRELSEELLSALLKKIFEAMRGDVQSSTQSSIDILQFTADLKG
ncbi:type III secretion system translocon subunit SctE [Desulfospira joergensenii]|uniref:type III secretion system translocon subunit SctE n=1 Tax=Desulfospira joergensenii TaxID=53329 RepID=UPI0003B5534F|nr:type III secretion system translocon subunit SctE [Desulfospira joergensenii]